MSEPRPSQWLEQMRRDFKRQNPDLYAYIAAMEAARVLRAAAGKARLRGEHLRLHWAGLDPCGGDVSGGAGCRCAPPF